MHNLLSVVSAAVLALVTSPALDAKHLPHSKPAITVAILMFDGVQIIDFAGPYEVFGQAGFGVLTLSEDGEPVETAMGLHTSPDHSFANAPDFDVLLVPGGDVGKVSENAAAMKLIRRHAGVRKQIMSVCTGAVILAKAGVLDGIKATTFHRALTDLRVDFPAVDVVKDVRWTDDENIITSAGLSSGIDAALHLVSKHRSVEIARSTALHLEYDWQPEQGFVRTALADRYLPDVQVDWPRRTQLKTLFSIGDEAQWQRRFLITSPKEIDTLLALIQRAMDGQKNWSRGGAESHSWTSMHGNKQLHIQLAHIRSRGRDHELEISLRVE